MPRRPRHFRVDAEATIELRLGALQRGMHNVAAQDYRCAFRPHHDTNITRGVPRPRLVNETVAAGVVGGSGWRVAVPGPYPLFGEWCPYFQK